MLKEIRRTRFVLLVTCALSCAAASVASGQTVTANNIPPGPVVFAQMNMAAGIEGLPGTNVAAAQKFTATVVGALDSIIVTLDPFASGGEPLIVGIRDGNGVGPGALLAEITVPEASFPPPWPVPGGTGVQTFDFSSAGAILHAGQSYFVTFRTLTPAPTAMRYRIFMQDPNPSFFGFVPYQSDDGGATWSELPSNFPAAVNEIGMTVFVSAVCLEDLDGNGVVDLGDLSLLLFNFGAGPGGDVTGDGLTDLADLSALLFVFGQACP